MLPMTTIYPRSLVERFWSKVQICAHGEDCRVCCWEWQAGKTRGGYGHLGIPKAYRTGRTKNERANRVCWRIVYGAIPVGMDVLHNCPNGDNPTCVHPWHLWLGTGDDNQKDSMRKGRRPTGDQHGLRLHPDAILRGEANPSASLHTSDIVPIFQLAAAGMTQPQIALRYGVHRATIGMILRRQNWRHVVVPAELLQLALPLFTSATEQEVQP